MWLWHLPFCRHSSNPRLFMSCASSAMFGLLHETPGAKKQVQGIEVILTGNMADMASNSKGYQRQPAFQPTGWLQGISKLQCSLSSRGVWVATIFKTLILEAPITFQIFLASRGSTPLHFAACDGHDSVVQRLLEAKAAVDAKDEDGRGLEYEGAGWKRPCGMVVRKWMQCCCQVFSFCWKLSAKICTLKFAVFCAIYVFCTSLFTNKTYPFDHFCLAVFGSDHCNHCSPRLITKFPALQWTLTSWFLPAH